MRTLIILTIVVGFIAMVKFSHRFEVKGMYNPNLMGAIWKK